MAYTTRFAPSPTGLLHVGNGFSALTGWQRARACGGSFRLRIEDLDTERCRPDFDAAIERDLAWLGLDWDGPVLRQSERGAHYAEAIARLRGMGLVYPCFCTRADIAAAAIAPHGPGGPVYPRTCRHLADSAASRLMAEQPFAWRLDVAAGMAMAGPLAWTDSIAGTIAAAPVGGDIVVGRKGVGTSYHLAVVIDDAAQGVTEVVRGVDLFAASHVQRLLQALLGLPVPVYHHHPLILGTDGKRLAKRDAGLALAALRARGLDPAKLRAMMADPATAWPVGPAGVDAHL